MQKKPDVFEFMRSRPLLSLMIGGVIFAAGIYFSDIPRMIASPGWPTTEGTIASNRLMGVRFEEYDGDFYTQYDAYIRYQYSVNGITYDSLSINSIETHGYPSSFASRYPVGKDVVVYYNPKDPSEAVLEPGFADIFKAFDVFSYFFFGGGIYFIYVGISRIKNMHGRNRGKS